MNKNEGMKNFFQKRIYCSNYKCLIIKAENAEFYISVFFWLPKTTTNQIIFFFCAFYFCPLVCWMTFNTFGSLEEATGLVIRFIIGRTEDKSKMSELMKEVAEYDDFILLDIKEEYSKLPYKTLVLTIILSRQVVYIIRYSFKLVHLFQVVLL